MAIVNVGFQNKNESRNYPLHDIATRLDTLNRQLPNNIISDLHLLVPASLGTAIFVSSVGLSSGLVSVTFQAAVANPSCPGSSAAASFIPVAAVSIPKPVIPYKNYRIEGIYPGVGGWIAFGAGVAGNVNASYLFEDPAATFLMDKVARTYAELPIPSVGKIGFNKVLTGLVRLKGAEGAVKTSRGVRVINGALYVVGVIGMDFGTEQVAQLEAFAGVCGHRPIAGNCNLAPVTSINDVKPDCNGDIAIRFTGLEVIGDTGDGIIIDYPLGLADVCQRQPFERLPNEGVDLCAPFLDPDFPPPPPPFNPPEPSSTNSSDTPGDDLTPYLCEDFQHGSELEVRIGEFSLVTSQFTPPRLVLQTAAGNAGDQLAVDLLRELDISNPLDTFFVETEVRPISGRLEGHLVFGYKHDANFFFAGVSVDPGLVPLPGYPEGRFFIGKRTAVGPPWSLALGYGYNFLSGAIYVPPEALINGTFKLRVTVTNLVSVVQISLRVDWVNSEGTPFVFEVNHNTPIASFNLLGFAGLGCVASQVQFNNFGINCDFPSSSSSGSSSSAP